jgi:putative membrane protein
MLAHMDEQPSSAGAGGAASGAPAEAFSVRRAGMANADRLVSLALIALGGLLWWISRYHAAGMPVWGPWDFSWLWYLTAAFGLWWYAAGLMAMPRDERPAWWRTLAYVAGVLATYTVLQTHFEYLAEHMFFLNRVQHVVMHHIGPFLIVLAWPGAVLRRGMPAFLRPLIAARPLLAVIRVIQQPFLASVLFVGLVALWLIPPIHFRAMIDPQLYQVMNWSMVVDGLLFWTLVLDPRPQPPARVSFGGRIAMTLAVVPPQLLIGAIIAFTTHDIYNFYAWCGRIYPSIDAISDQQLGGANIWIPPAMMSGVALLLVLNAFRLDEERRERERIDEADDGTVTIKAAWTG